MKKHFLLFFIILNIFSLTSCTKNNVEKSSSTEGSDEYVYQESQITPDFDIPISNVIKTSKDQFIIYGHEIVENEGQSNSKNKYSIIKKTYLIDNNGNLIKDDLIKDIEALGKNVLLGLDNDDNIYVINTLYIGGEWKPYRQLSIFDSEGNIVNEFKPIEIQDVYYTKMKINDGKIYLGVDESEIEILNNEGRSLAFKNFLG